MHWGISADDLIRIDLSHGLQSLAVHTSAADLLSLRAIVVVLAVVTVVACIVPAQRGARVDPMVASESSRP